MLLALLAAGDVALAAALLGERRRSGRAGPLAVLRRAVGRGGALGDAGGDPVWAHARDTLALAAGRSVDVVLLGDSLTQLADWPGLLRRERVAAQGMGGDTAGGLRARLDLVLAARPRLCAVMVGYNDLAQGRSPEDVARDVAALLHDLVAAGVEPLLQLTLPVTAGHRRSRRLNAAIARLDELLVEHAADAGVEVLDLRPAVAPDGVLADRFSTDGVHLTANGYVAWRDALEPRLARRGL